jgi:hypothetical protein
MASWTSTFEVDAGIECHLTRGSVAQLDVPLVRNRGMRFPAGHSSTWRREVDPDPLRHKWLRRRDGAGKIGEVLGDQQSASPPSGPVWPAGLRSGWLRLREALLPPLGARPLEGRSKKLAHLEVDRETPFSRPCPTRGNGLPQGCLPASVQS